MSTLQLCGDNLVVYKAKVSTVSFLYLLLYIVVCLLCMGVCVCVCMGFCLTQIKIDWLKTRLAQKLLVQFTCSRIYRTRIMWTAAEYNLPEYLRDPELSMDTFRHQLKTFLFAEYCRRRYPSTLETFVSLRSINLLLTLHYICITNTTTTTNSLRVYTMTTTNNDGHKPWPWRPQQ